LWHIDTLIHTHIIPLVRTVCWFSALLGPSSLVVGCLQVSKLFAKCVFVLGLGEIFLLL